MCVCLKSSFPVLYFYSSYHCSRWKLFFDPGTYGMYHFFKKINACKKEGHIWASQESGSKRKWESSNEQNGCFSPKTMSWCWMLISVIHLALGGRSRSQAPSEQRKARRSWVSRTQLATVQRSVTWSSFPHSCTAPIVSLNLNVGVCEVFFLFFFKGTNFSFWWFLVPCVRQLRLWCDPAVWQNHTGPAKLPRSSWWKRLNSCNPVIFSSNNDSIAFEVGWMAFVIWNLSTYGWIFSLKKKKSNHKNANKSPGFWGQMWFHHIKHMLENCTFLFPHPLKLTKIAELLSPWRIVIR